MPMTSISNLQTRFFIGISPPDDYLFKIKDFQLKWRSNKLPHTVDPHITVKSRAGLTEDKVWQEDIKKACLTIKPFNLQIGKPAWFGKDVLFLSVEGKNIFKLHELILDIVNPSLQLQTEYFEGKNFHSHLTLGSVRQGMSHKELLDMEQLALDNLNATYNFEVKELWLYYCEEKVSKKYDRILSLPLANFR